MTAVRQDRGFTLIEVLVVLIITSLIATLMLQGFRQVLDLRIRYLELGEAQDIQFLEQHWFATVCRGVVPGIKDGESRFKGDQRGFSGLTVGSLLGDLGVPQPFRVWLDKKERHYVLQYQEDKRAHKEMLAVLHSPQASFAYLDAQGKVVSRWPPPGASEDSIPRGITLTMRQGGGQTEFWTYGVLSELQDWEDQSQSIFSSLF